MKKFNTLCAIALLFAGTATAATKPKPIFAENGNFAIQTNIFAGYDVKGNGIVHIKLSNVQPYTTVCTVTDKETKKSADVTLSPGKETWLYDAVVPLTFDITCKLKK